jgi:hypothetical protein
LLGHPTIRNLRQSLPDDGYHREVLFTDNGRCQEVLFTDNSYRPPFPSPYYLC